MVERHHADVLAIPACDHEAHNWRPTHPELYSRSEVRRQSGQYESVITPDITSWQPALTGQLVADLADAEQALTEFDTYSVTSLGVEDGLIVPMSAILLRIESASSSQIENLTVSAKQLALAELDQTRSVNARTVVGNVRSMEAALELSSEISEQTLLVMHEALLRNEAGYAKHAGNYRDQVVWIGGDNAGPRGAAHVAPQPAQIAQAMQDLFSFVAREDLPILMHAAIAHAQFETIHPFVDGNGRTGRALVHAMLRNKGLVTHTTAPISAGLLVDLDAYFVALGDYRRGDAGPIVIAFANAARFAAVTGRRLVNDLRAALDESRLKLTGVRAHAHVWKVLPVLVSQPIVNARYLKQKFGFTDAVAHNVLATLSERGVLVERTGLQRNRVWQHPGILDVLDQYAKQIRRPA